MSTESAITSGKNYINMIIILQFVIESLLLFLIDCTISGKTGESPEEEQQEDIVDFAGLPDRGREIGEVNLSVDDLRPAIEVDNTKTSEEVNSLDIAFFNITLSLEAED
jgi:hypothetical protein